MHQQHVCVCMGGCADGWLKKWFENHTFMCKLFMQIPWKRGNRLKTHHNIQQQSRQTKRALHACVNLICWNFDSVDRTDVAQLGFLPWITFIDLLQGLNWTLFLRPLIQLSLQHMTLKPRETPPRVCGLQTSHASKIAWNFGNDKQIYYNGTEDEVTFIKTHNQINNNLISPDALSSNWIFYCSKIFS